MATNRKSTSTLILDVLIKNPSQELTIYGIAQKAKLSYPRVAYVIPKLLESGLIISKSNGKATYSIQRIHVDKQKITSLLQQLEPLIKTMYDQLELEQAKDPEEALGNNLALFIARKVINVKY